MGFSGSTNQGSGSNLFSSNKDEFNLEVRKRLNIHMNKLYGYDRAEWLYWHIKPVLLVVKYLLDQFDQLSFIQLKS